MTISSRPRSRAMRAPHPRGVLAAGLLLLLAWGCGDSEPEPPAAPPAATPGAKAPVAKARAPGAGAEGVEVGDAGPLPKDFPADLPVYPDAQPTRWMAAEGPGSLVVFEAEDEPDEVYGFFTAELPGAGWQIQSQGSGGGHWTLVAAKTGRTARISIISVPEGGAQFGIAVADAR